MNGADGARVTYSGTQLHVDVEDGPSHGKHYTRTRRGGLQREAPMTLPKTERVSKQGHRATEHEEPMNEPLVLAQTSRKSD